MKDFEDDYTKVVSYKQYFPYYQMMGYQQLRTYFTWRTQLRRGKVERTSLSYAYLYFYELLNNIGVVNSQDGLDKLLFFWKEFRKFEPSIDKYVFRWLKDYHIYYDLPQSFPEFIRENELTEHYPDLAGSENRFDLFCTLSKYDIRNSRFMTGDRETLIRECFNFTIDKVSTVFSEHGIDLENEIFFPTKSRAIWRPFQDALFFPWLKQRDRSVALSSKEIYICSRNQWSYQTALTAESGRRLVGYILKQMESVLREAVNYKYKITAGIAMLHPATVQKLTDGGIGLEQVVADAVKEFYREATKTVVTVDRENLARIRREALETQEKLLVPEEDSQPKMTQSSEAGMRNPHGRQEAIDMESRAENPWKDLSLTLTQTERQALLIILHGDTDIRQFADAHGIMPEVLADGINEKAVDTVGDSLLDDEFMIYGDYLDLVKEILEA